MHVAQSCITWPMGATVQYSTVHVQVQYTKESLAHVRSAALPCHQMHQAKHMHQVQYSAVQYSTVQYSTAHGFCMFRCLVLPILHSVKVSTAVFFMYTTVATYCVWSNAICYAYPQHIFWLQYMCDVAYSLLILQTIEDGYGELEGIDLKQLA